VFFHHDPGHDDARLDAIAAEAASRWDRGDGEIELAREGRSIDLAA
jgi:hypothetical protein